MVRIALLLFLLVAGFVTAQEGPRLEVLRTLRLNGYGPFDFGEARDGSFLSVEFGGFVPGFRLVAMTREGHRRLLTRMRQGSPFGSASSILLAHPRGGWIRPSDLGESGGLLSIDERGVVVSEALAPADFGIVSQDFVLANDGAFYGLTYRRGVLPRGLYRWTPDAGFVGVLEFFPAPSGATEINNLIAGRSGGLFALKREFVPAAPGSVSTVVAWSRLALSTVGAVHEGPRLLDVSTNGFGELPDERLVTVTRTAPSAVPHTALMGFDSQGVPGEIASLDALTPHPRAALLCVLPGSGCSIVVLDDASGFSQPLRLVSLTPGGLIEPLPLIGAGAGIAGFGRLVLSHDGNYYGFAYRAAPDGRVDRVLFFRIVDPQAVVRNLPPIAKDDFIEAPAVTAGGGQVNVALAPLGNDSDADGDALTIESAGVDAPLVATVSPDRRQIALTFPAGAPLVASLSYRIADGRGGTAEARIHVRIPERSGRFSGLLHTAEGEVQPLRGFLDVQVSRLGRVTGVFFVEGMRCVIRGQFDVDGRLDIEVPIPGAGVPVLHLRRDGNVIRGEIAVFNIDATLAATRAQPPPPRLTGRYTAVFRPGTLLAGRGLPAGIGWALVNVSRSGRITIAGRLGDGSPLSAGSRLDGSARFPVYAGPRRITEANSIGELAGTASLRAGPQRDGDGVLRWNQGTPTDRERPNFFTGTVSMVLSRFVPPAKPSPLIPGLRSGSGNAELLLGGGFLPRVRTNPVTVTEERIESGSGDTGIIPRGDGRVFIRMQHRATGESIYLRGVVLQAAGHAEGYFIARSGLIRSSGYFTLVPR